MPAYERWPARSSAGGVAQSGDEAGADEEAYGPLGRAIELHAVLVGAQQERHHAISARGGVLAHTVLTGDDHVIERDNGVSFPFSGG